jgi:hypothetical protein
VTLKVRRVESKKDLKKFIRLPWRLYRGDPNWVPPLMMDLRKRMNPKKNPFFRNAEVAYFLAERPDRPVGRICAIRNGLHNEYHRDKVGFFGFFESERDPEVTGALMDAAAEWLRGQGMDTMRGPANYSENEEYGLLVKGFDRPPMAIMPYNPEFYVDLLEGAGFLKAMDLYAWYVDRESINIPPKVERIVDRVRKKPGVTFRDVNVKDVRAELGRIKTIYNDAWSKNWGFLPWTDELLEYMAPDFKMILIPELVMLAEVNGEPAGFSLVIPDVNQLIKEIKGRLFPFGWIRMLTGLRKTRGIRYVVMGVREKFRIRGLETVFYVETLRRAKAMGYQFCEMSWVLEDNDRMNAAAEAVGGVVYKTYRIYDKKL